MIRGASYRGQPLVAFLLIVGGWIALRVMAWDAGVAGAFAPSEPVVPVVVVASPRPVPPFARERQTRLALDLPEQTTGWSFASNLVRRTNTVGALVRPGPRTPLTAARRRDPAATAPVVSQMRALAAQPEFSMPSGSAAQSTGQSAQRASRWSADAWLLARSGGGTALPSGLSSPSYGASQMGAVLRYRLDLHSGHRPTAYLRGSAALNGSGEREVAAGVSARPIARLPLALAAEARVNRQPGRTRLRPAAFAYTELPPVHLPLHARAEAYGQAGYVGGTFASAFADGQLRIDRRVMQVGQGELRAGGGAWGGAQKGASRLDVGPAATLAMPLSESAAARLAVDWRFRVAGNAAPASGPALTLSAGF